MRVVHLACVAPPEIGGIGQVAFHEVEKLCERGIEARLESKAWIRFGHASIVKGLQAKIQNADIVHLHYPWYGVAEPLLWSPPKKPLVVTFHMDATADDWRGWIFDAHRRFLQSRLLRHVSCILVSSKDYAEHSSLRRYRDELGEKIIELPFGTDTEFFSPLDSRFSIHDSRFTILFVGGLDRAHHFKGLSILLEAMKTLPSSARLVIVGDGDARQAFEKQTKDFGLIHRVEFRGRVDRAGLRQAYREASVLAFPSTHAAEAFGLAALEAQSCGVPVVASALPGVRTVVFDHQTGLLVPPGSATALREALLFLQTHEHVRRDYGVAARARVLALFSHDRHMDRLMEIYQDVLRK